MSEGNLKRLQSTEPEDVKARNFFFKRLSEDKHFPAQVRTAMNWIMIDTFEKKHPIMPEYGKDLYLPCKDIVKQFSKTVAIS